MFDLMSRMRREMSAAEPAVKPQVMGDLFELRFLSFTFLCNKQIDTLVILDRSVDLLSPLATQLTYEGLIDEIFSINQTTVRLPAQKFTRQSPVRKYGMPRHTVIYNVMLKSTDKTRRTTLERCRPTPSSLHCHRPKTCTLRYEVLILTLLGPH